MTNKQNLILSLTLATTGLLLMSASTVLELFKDSPSLSLILFNLMVILIAVVAFVYLIISTWRDSKADYKARDVQSTFNAVLEARLYSPGSPITPATKHAKYMCNSLALAYDEGVITREQSKCARESIYNYLKSGKGRGNTTLRNVLSDNDLPHQSGDLLTIYKDWDNRPTFIK